MLMLTRLSQMTSIAESTLRTSCSLCCPELYHSPMELGKTFQVRQLIQHIWFKFKLIIVYTLDSGVEMWHTRIIR